MSSIPKKRRAQWTEKSLEAAVAAVQRGQLSQHAASARHGIPRRTIRNHLKSGKTTRELGRKTILTKEQEKDLVERIMRFSEIGIPLTPKVIRRQTFIFCTKYNIPNNFNKENGLAGKDWLKLFLKRNPTISRRKAQFLNPARAQKLNRHIVSHHFDEVRKLFDELDLYDRPELIYNMDEKGCRLTFHHQQTVLAKKGTKRVHFQASEHAENVTVVGCVNALGNAIPPMIIFKGKRMKPEFNDNLPAGSMVRMAPKGSMTTELFIDFINHLGNYKTNGKCLLIFDGASSHLDYRIVEAAERHQIVLYCLPSNTTHELQPLDKAVYRSFEHHWDQELLQYLHQHPDRRLTKARFNVVLTKVWSKCMTHENITSGFRATGLHPFNPDAIPEIAFAPSLLTEIPEPCSQILETEENPQQSSPIASTSHSHVIRHPIIYNTTSESSDSELHVSQPRRPRLRNRIYSTSSESENGNIPSQETEQTTEKVENIQAQTQELLRTPFQELLRTPDYATTKNKPRRHALNYKGQRVTKYLFKDNELTKRKQQSTNLSPQKKTLSKPGEAQDGWYCHGCAQERIADMRQCTQCFKWYHEECVGLTKDDHDIFVCPQGCN